METNICKLNNIFEKIYVIHCVENEKRLENIKFQIEKNNLDLDIWWTCYHPWSQEMANGLILSNCSRYLINGKELNLTREFYTIIKTSYYKGYNNILIFEDDFSLMKNEYLNEFIDDIPNDFDIIQFSILGNNLMLGNKTFENEYNNGLHFIEPPEGYWSNCGLALSRKGMKYFIDYIDDEFVSADIPIFENKNKTQFYGRTDIKSGLKHYISTVPLVYLKDMGDSQVQDTDKSELYNYYKNIEETYYNIL